MKVKCPNCKRMDFVTTEKYLPDVTPNGSFVKCLLPFKIDWLEMSTTLVSEMTCPHCLGQLAPAGRLTVIPEDPIKEFFEPTGPIDGGTKINVPLCDDLDFMDKVLGDDPLSTIQASEPAGQSGDSPGTTPAVTDPEGFICSVCGREFKTKFALTGHSRSHKEATS